MPFTRPKAAQIDFDVTNISDPLIRLNSAESGSADKDAGLVIERGSDTNVALIYDESADAFALINTDETGTTSGNVTISSYAGLRANTIVYGSLNDGTTTLTATVAELNYVDGVTSNIQTQIDNISSSFTLAADSGSNDTFTTGETLTIAGGTGIDTTVSDNNISVAIDSTVATLTGTQTLENKTLRAPTFESGSNAPEFLETRYVNATQMDFVQLYTGGSNGSYFTQGEYQKVATIIPDGDSQNYTFRLRMTATSASNYQIVEFTGALRSNTLPDLTFTSNYFEEHNGTRFIEPKLWTKETTTAGFILAFEYVHNANLYGGVNVEATIIPRSDAQRSNVTFNTTQDSEQTTIDTGYTENDPTLIYSNVSGTLEFGTQFRIEGSTADGNELTITATDPTADRTITFPDATGTVALTSDISLSTLSVTSTATELNLLDGITGITLGSANETLIVDTDGNSITTTDLLAFDTVNNRVGIGTTSPATKFHIAGEGSANEGQIRLQQAYDGSDGPDFAFYASRGTIASPTSTADNDTQGRINAYVHNGTNFVQSGSFGWSSDGTDGDNTFDIRSRVGGTLASRIEVVASGDIEFQDGAFDVDVKSHDGTNGLKLGGTLVTSSAAELNILDGVTATTTELNLLDGVTGLTLGDANEILIVGTGGTAITSTSVLSIDDGNNYIGINQTSPEVTLHMTGEASQSAQIRMEQMADTADAPDIRTRKSRGTAAAPTKNSAGDFIYRQNHERYNGTGWTTVGQLAVDTDGTNADRFKMTFTVSEDGTNIDAANNQLLIDGADSGAITFNQAYKFPTADGSANQFLQTNGSGTITFESPTVSDISDLTATATELNYVDGVTSAIQTQLDAKLALAGGTMSGAIAMGTNKITGMGDPIANQDAATKAYVDTQTSSIVTTTDIAGDTGTDTVTLGSDTLTFSGTANEITTAVTDNTVTISLPDDVTIGSDLTVTGNLTVNGTTTTISTTNSVVADSLIELNTGAGSNANDLGIVMERGSTGDNAIFAWDESADAFVMGTTTATGESTGDLTIANGELRLDTLRIDQSGTGLRMTNVGAFDNDGSDNFRIFSTNDLQLKANGDSGGGLSIDVTNNDVTIDNDLRVSAGQFYYGGTAVTSTATELNLLDGVTGTLVTEAGTQTLTNKTLTSPTITGTGAIAGTFTGNITGDVTGNADTATALATARNIAGNSFDGTGDITIASTDLSDTSNLVRNNQNNTITSTTSGSSAAPEFELFRDITGADSNYIGQIKFSADNDADQKTVFAKITGKIGDASDGSEDGIIEIAHIKAGSQNINVRMTSTEFKILNGTDFDIETHDGSSAGLRLNNTLVTATAAELNILDGVTATASELNIIDGDTSATSTTLADADRVVVNDAGTMKQVALTDFETYFETALDTLSNVTSVGTLNGLAVASTQTISLGSNRVQNVADPVGNQDAATKAYVDANAGSGGGASGFTSSTFTTAPGSDGDFDLSFNVAQDTQENPFESGGSDPFGVALGEVYDMMEPVGSTSSVDLASL